MLPDFICYQASCFIGLGRRTKGCMALYSRDILLPDIAVFAYENVVAIAINVF